MQQFLNLNPKKFLLLFSFILNLFLFIRTNQENKSDKLRFVFGIFRHGARAPWNNMDRNNIDVLGSKWEARSALTGVGKRQHYLIGFKNKQKYFNTLNMTKKNNNDIVLFSTKTSRTMMSIYSEVFGMYPTSTGPQLNNEQLNFALPPIKNFNFTDEINSLKTDALKKRVNPLPLRIFDKYAHFFGLNDPRICKPLEDIKIANKKSAKFKNYTDNIIKQYGSQIMQVIGNEDLNTTWLEEYGNIYSVFDSFMANYFDGRDLSKFENAGLDINNFYNLSIDFLHWDQYYINYGDKDNYAGRMSFSPVVKYLIETINNRIQMDLTGDDLYDPQNPKMMLYSAHDTSLAALTVFFRYMFGERVKEYYPFFASSYYIEVYKNETQNIGNDFIENDEKYYLNILFNEENILGQSISFKEFKNQIESKLISEREINHYCGFDIEDSSNYVLNIVITVILSVCLIALSCVFWRIRAKRNEEMRNTLYSQI